MTHRKKVTRKPDLRRIRTSRSYTISEAAKCLDRTRGTVRRWIKDGLPVLDCTSPLLIHGDDLKAWLLSQSRAKRRKCGLGQMYCLVCREPRKPQPKTVKTTPNNNPRTVLISARCAVCESAINITRKVADLPEILAAMKPAREAKTNLTGYVKPSLNEHFWEGQGELDFGTGNEVSKIVH